MKIIVTKFYREVNTIFDTAPRDCYFGSNVNYVDFIELTQFIYPDGIPSYMSELTKPGEVLEPKASDYSVLIPYPSKDQSRMGSTVREFFSLDKEYIYRAVVVSGGINRQVGFIDNNSIILDLSVTGQGFAISFTVYSAVRNWEAGAKSVLYRTSLDYGVNDITIDTALQYMIFSTGLQIINRVKLTEIVRNAHGFTPKRTGIHTAFADTGIHTVLLDTLKAFGVAFQIEPLTNMRPNQWERLLMRLYFPNDGISSTSVLVENFHKKGVLIEPTMANIIIPLSEFQQIVHPAGARYEGYATGITHRASPGFTGGRWGYELVKDWTVTGLSGQAANINWMLARGTEQVYYTLSNSNSTVFDLQMNDLPFAWVDVGGQKKSISAPRFYAKKWQMVGSGIYTDEGYPQIIEAICNYRFDLFLATLRESREIRVPYDDIFAIQAGQKFSFLNQNYLINRVSDKNERKKNVQLYITRAV